MSQINTQTMSMLIEQNYMTKHPNWVNKIKTYHAAKYHLITMKKLP